MERCRRTVCRNCTCAVQQLGLTVASVPANSNFLCFEKPKHVVRRDPRKAAEDFKKRFKGSLEILS